MQLETFFPYRLAVVAEAFSRNLTTVYGAEYGLTREEWRLLFLLATSRQMNSLELARRTTLDKVQVSRASARLDQKGLITRAVADRDRRLREYSITDKGQTLFDSVLPEVQARATTILERLSPEEYAALDAGLAALRRAITAEGATELPPSAAG